MYCLMQYPTNAKNLIIGWSIISKPEPMSRSDLACDEFNLGRRMLTKILYETHNNAFLDNYYSQFYRPSYKQVK
jgi:hypothetical protein